MKCDDCGHSRRMWYLVKSEHRIRRNESCPSCGSFSGRAEHFDIVDYCTFREELGDESYRDAFERVKTTWGLGLV